MDYIKYIRGKVGHDLLILVVVIGVAEKDGKILMVRKKGQRNFGLPGGFIDIGETAEETLKREMREETSLQATPTGLLGVYTNYPVQTYPNGDKAHVIHIVLACTVKGTPVPDGDEIEEIKFVDKKNALNSRHKILIKDYLKGNRGVIR